MSFANKLHAATHYIDPIFNSAYKLDIGYDTFKPSTPPPPNTPNENDATNAAQTQTDAMRQRRGLLANIYAGNTASAPVTGKTALGT